MNSKQEIRNKMLSAREALSEKLRKEHSASICETLYMMFHANPFYADAVFLSYAAIRGEADIREFSENMMFHAADFYYPVVIGDRMDFYRATPDTEFVPGAFGCPEPGERDKKLSDSSPVVVLVPGVAFSEKGARIGYGKGYYDRFLAARKNVVKKVGICFESQISREIVPSETDVLMDIIVTEERTIRI